MFKSRLFTAMITPFDKNLEVNLEKTKEFADYLINTGNEGLVVCGTTGESPTLSHKEKISLFKTVKETIGNRGEIIAGTGSYCTKSSIELTKAAEEVGVDGIMLVVPYYNKPPQAALYEHFKAIANSTELPIMLYNVPGRTSMNLLPETVQKLAEIPNIVAIKEAVGNMDQVSALKSLLPEEFLVYSGDDSLTLPMLALGCQGVVSVAGNVYASEINEMIKSFVAGDVEKAAKLHQRLLPLFKAMFITTNPIPVKAAVNLLGLEVGSLRLPLIDANSEQLAIIRNAMEELNLKVKM